VRMSVFYVMNRMMKRIARIVREDQVREGSGPKQGSHIKVGVNLLVGVDVV
jgi:hypothetical protein